MADILFLAHRIPYPPNRGDKIRAFHVLRKLTRLGRVHLATFADDEADAAHLAGLKAALPALGDTHVEPRRVSRSGAAIRALAARKPLSLTLFDSRSLRAFVAERLGSVGAVYAFSGQMAQYVPTGFRGRFVMDFVDMDSEKFASYAAESRGPMRAVYTREARRLFAFEHEVAERADASLFVSEAEARLFRERTGLPRIHAVGNGIDSDHFDPSAGFPRLDGAERGEGPVLLFTGQMDYRPNVDAVTWFAREVLPIVPGARFVIAGRDPAQEVRALANARVQVTGAVEDMRSWLEAADIVVAPLRIARGVQNKVLEAMAMARPVVASSAAFEGIEAQPGRHLIVADGAAAMARAVQALLDEPARARRLGEEARSHVVRAYGWDCRLAPLEGLLFPASAPVHGEALPRTAAAVS